MSTSIHPAQDSLAAPVGQVRLRRAVYVHISDLTSAYDIDHRKLEQELSRVRAECQSTAFAPPSLAAVTAVSTEDMDANSYPQKRLQPPRGGYNLCVLVGKVNVVVDKRRVDGSRVRLAEVEVGDETGIVSLRARDEQIDVLREVSARDGAVVLRNCMLELYQGKHVRLAVTKWGKLNTYPDQVASTPPPPSKRNQDRNFSLIDLSLVASETFHSDKAGTLQQEMARIVPGKMATQGQSLRAGGVGPQQPYQPHSQQNLPPPQGKRGGGRGTGGTGGPNRQQRNTRIHAPPPQQPQPPLPSGLHYGDQYQVGWHEHSIEPYGYAESTTMSTATAHTQMLLRQQYQIQQRQIQQMFHEQRQQIAAVASPRGSFGADPQAQAQSQQQPHMLIGSASPLLMSLSSQISAPVHSVHPQYQQQQQQQQLSPDQLQQQFGGGADSPNKMNPQAATFAPTHGVPCPSFPQPSSNPHSHGLMPARYTTAPNDRAAGDSQPGQAYHPGVAVAPSSGRFQGVLTSNLQQQPYDQQQRQQPQPSQGRHSSSGDPHNTSS